MKVRVYMRLARAPRARDGWRVFASLKANPRPLVGPDDQPLHTLRFVLDLDVADAALRPAEWPTVEVEVPASNVIQIPERVEVVGE